MWVSMSSVRLDSTLLPFATGMIHHFGLVLHWSISISLPDLLDVGHCLCTTSCRAPPAAMNCACGISSVFSRCSAPVPVPQRVYSQQSSGSSRLSASVSVLLVHLLELFLCRLDSLLDFHRVLSTWQWRCRLHSWSVHHSDELPGPESEAYPECISCMLCITFLVSTCFACSVIGEQVFHSCRDGQVCHSCREIQVFSLLS